MPGLDPGLRAALLDPRHQLVILQRHAGLADGVLRLADAGRPAVAVGFVMQWRRSCRASLVVLTADTAANGNANYVVITAPGITP